MTFAKAGSLQSALNGKSQLEQSIQSMYLKLNALQEKNLQLASIVTMD
jgi:hypothetical protein